MRHILLLCLLLLCSRGKAQSCDCTTNFRYMVNKMEHNYVGFSDKVTSSNRAAYERMTDSLQQSIAGADAPACLQAMKKWLEFFRDLHVSVFINEEKANHNTIRKLFQHTRQIPVSEKELKTYLDHNGRLDSLEGIWEDEAGLYRIGIMRNKQHPDEFEGVVLKADSLYWMPGQVKMEIKKSGDTYALTAYASRDHVISTPAFKVSRLQLEIGAYGSWYKTYPGENKKPAPLVRNTDPYFSTPGEKVCVLTIPSAGMNNKRKVDSILNQQYAYIKRTPHLVIDLRNNTGGSVLCFEKLYPLLYTHPIITKGASVMATEDNITNYYDMWDFPGVSDSMKAVFKKDAQELRAHLGGICHLWPPDTLKFNEVEKYPQKVSIIINEYCASSAELFLLKAKQSSKVTLYGTHTMGAVDYADAVTLKMPCALFSLRYSTSRSDRLPDAPIDNIGIQPDVKIPGGVKDWVEYVSNLQQ